MTERRDLSPQEVAQNLQGQPEAVFKTETFEILTGKSNPRLARDIASNLGMIVDEPITVFKDGEVHSKISQNLRRKEIFIIQPTVRNQSGASVNDALVELLQMSSAARRASADEITAVMPYYGYARQDRKDQPRVTIAAADVANLLETAGVHRILTIDIHAEQVEGAFKGPWDNIYASKDIIPEINKQGLSDLLVVSPDVGGTKRAEKFSFLLGGGGEIAIVHKRREKANESVALAVVGGVKDRDVLLVDDIIDTAGTITNAATLLRQNGAKSVRIAATHGLFSSPALELIEKSPVEQVFITDTIELSEEVRAHPKITVVSMAPLLADAIHRIHTGESVSALIPKPGDKS